jgi:serine/threonine-protein kinase
MAFLIASAIPEGVALAQEPSAGDVAQGRELYNQGMDLREKGDAQAALEKIRAADGLIHSPITAIELGRTYQQVGKLVEARETFLSIQRIPVGRQETRRSTAARTEGAKLADEVRQRIPSLTVRVTGVPPETVAITIDGASVPNDALVAPRLLNPGSHTVVATSTTGGRAETAVDLKEGETRDVELKIAFTGESPARSPASAPPLPAGGIFGEQPPAIANPGRTQRILGLVIGGVGVVGMGVSSALALVAKSQYDTSVGETGAARHNDSVSAHGLADGASVVFVAGAVVAATGAVVWLTAPRAPVAVGANGRGLFLAGTFE